MQILYNAIFGVHRNMDSVISKLCYKETILHRNYRKMTIKWSFSYNSFVKFHGKKFGSDNMNVISKSMLY